MAQPDPKKTDHENAPLLTRSAELLGGESGGQVTTQKTLVQVLPKWWKVARLWFYGSDKWRARCFMAAAIILSVLRTLLLVQISYTQRNFETALAEKDKVRFHKSLVGFSCLIAFAAPFFAANDFIEDRLKIEWRNWLTKELLQGYYGNRSFYKLHHDRRGVDNPDQRICDDVPAFTEGSTDLLIGITRKLFGVIAFSSVLWMVAPRLVFFLLAYTAMGTWLTTSGFGKRLMQLTYTALEREGDLRFALVRTRENSESIAFYAGETREAAHAAGRLTRLVALLRTKVAWMAGLSLWTNFYGYATILIPPILTAPRYFAGEVEFGVITQVGFAFRHIEGALNYFVDNLTKFSGLAAESERLDVLLAVLAQHSEQHLRILRIQQEDASLVLEGLTVRTPNGGMMICQGLDLSMRPGQSLLIVGASGCGKSSLLRAISGLWTSGTGTVHAPPADKMLFLPQKPYMPLGTLRDQLLYPSGVEIRDSQTGLRTAVSDEQLLGLLSRVALSGLAERVGGLDTDQEWSHILSLGEQQRVAFLRLLLHQPRLAFLDEATGALDTATGVLLYKALQQQCQSYVSVGHRKEIYGFHTHVLEHKGGWEWQLHSMAEYQRHKL